MTLSALGIFSAAGAGGVQGDYELISTTILGTAQASVVFDVSSFASTYKHLQLRTSTRSANSDGGLSMAFNSDTGNNYSFHALFGDGSTVASVASANRGPFSATYIYTTANQFSGAVIDILDPFSTTKNTTVRSIVGPPFISIFSGAWYNTASVTSITLNGGPNSMAVGSRLSLYGIKG
jgi:hypothetical protein